MKTSTSNEWWTCINLNLIMIIVFFRLFSVLFSQDSKIKGTELWQTKESERKWWTGNVKKQLVDRLLASLCCRFPYFSCFHHMPSAFRLWIGIGCHMVFDVCACACVCACMCWKCIWPKECMCTLYTIYVRAAARTCPHFNSTLNHSNAKLNWILWE